MLLDDIPSTTSSSPSRCLRGLSARRQQVDRRSPSSPLAVSASREKAFVPIDALRIRRDSVKMEPPSPRHWRIKTRSKKRALEESVKVDLENDVVELSPEEFDFEAKKSGPKGKGKGKQVMIQDVIDVDNDSLPDMTKKVKVGGYYKGKDLIHLSDGDDYDDKKEQSFTTTTTGGTGTANESYLNNFSQASSYAYEDNYNYFYQDDDLNYQDKLSHLQAQFEAADIPTGIEASLPWWLEPGKKNGQPVNFSGPSNFNFNSAQAILGSGPNQITHSCDNKSVEATFSSAGFSYTNGSKSVSPNHESIPENHVSCSSFVATPKKVSGGTQTPSANAVHEDAMRRIQHFDNFAIVDHYSDHHYANASFSTQKAWTKKIQEEWKILQSSLPETIFVRAYESNMALLRVMIIGPQGTPYHDGLFFFDVMFPSTYPQAPPHVHYHSGGLRLNPNLYSCGKVCLSLLGTWFGQSATENWIPGKSTMLQVLVSIQALILNANPYFNEPGYEISEGSAGGDKASKKYNEGTLIKSLKTMLYSMRRPPKHFEGFVSDYFITRSHGILLACKAYMDGAQVGSISIVEGKAVIGNDKRCSSSLKDEVGMILNSLIDEFSKLGVKNCEEFRIEESKNEESRVTSVRSSKTRSQNKSKSSMQKISKAKPKKSNVDTYLNPLPPVAWTSLTPAWISPLAVHASQAAMFSLPKPVAPKGLHNHPTDSHIYSLQTKHS